MFGLLLSLRPLLEYPPGGVWIGLTPAATALEFAFSVFDRPRIGIAGLTFGGINPCKFEGGVCLDGGGIDDDAVAVGALYEGPW